MNTKAQETDIKLTGGVNNKKNLIKETLKYFDTYRFHKDVKNYKQYLGFNIDRLSYISDRQSNISYPIGASIVNSTFANMYDFGYEFGILDDPFRKILNETFDYKNQGKICIGSMIKEGLITGKAYCRTSFIEEEIKLKLLGKYEITEKIKKPTIKFISKFNVYYDHNYSVEESPYQIERNLLTGEAIKKKYNGLLTEEQKIKLNDTIEKKSDINNSEFKAISSFDFNPVKEILSYQHSILNSLSTQKKSKRDRIKTLEEVMGRFSVGGLTTESVALGNIFKIDASKTYEVIEYEEGGEFTLFVNGNEIGSYNSDTRGVGRIRSIEFNSIPGTSESLGIMDMIGDLQSLVDSIWNSFIDNIKLQLTGMFKKKGIVEGLGHGDTLEFKKFGIVTLRGDADIERFDAGLSDFMPLNMIQYLDGFISKVIGVNDYELGGQHKVERVADGIDFMRGQYKSKLAIMIDSIQRLMSNVSKEWLVTYLTRYTEEELKVKGIHFSKELIEGTTIMAYKINGVDLKDLLSEENISFSYNALETIDMERDREKIMTLFQPLAQNGLVDQEQLWNVGLGKKFKDIWKQKKYQEGNTSGEAIGNTQGNGNNGQDLANTEVGKKLSDGVAEKYEQYNYTESGEQGEPVPTQPRYNSATIGKTPGGAKLRKITHELGSSSITENLSI